MISEVFLQDCMIGMKQYPDKYFELAIVDPPYGINAGIQSESSSTRGRKNGIVKRGTLASKDWDNTKPPRKYFDELFRISKHQIIWGGNYFTKYLSEINGWIVWNKLQSLETRSDGELAWTSFKRPLKIVPLLQDGFKRAKNVGYNQPIIYNVPFSGKQTIHPTQKPIQLYKWLLTNYANQGDKILDTHVGSGSSRIACDMLGFDFTGFEIDKDYFEAQEKRFKQYKQQLVIQF